MSTISSQLPSLSNTLASLAAQTQSATDSTIASFATPEPAATGTDTLDLSSSSQESQVQITAREIALQNRFSALEDSSAALTANTAAASLVGSSTETATAAQANLSASNVLNLLAEG